MTKKATKKKTRHSSNEVYNEVVLINKQICYFLSIAGQQNAPIKNYFIFNSACAADNLAIGTLYGEQDT